MKLKKRLRLLVAAVLPALAAVSSVTFAEDAVYGGHFKYQYTLSDYRADDLNTLLGSRDDSFHSLDGRLNAEKRVGAWTGIVQAEMLGAGGDAYHTLKKEQAFVGFASPLLVSDRRRLFDLTAKVVDERNFAVETRVDRLSVGYAGERFVAKLGRQAITWGNGLVFQALDIFNPFSPVAIDKEYKTGDDLAYAQYLLSNGDDLQVLAIPRRDAATRDVESSESAYASKYHGTLAAAGVDYDFVAARNYNENVFGGGLSRDVFGAVARADLAVFSLEEGLRTSFVANIDRSWTLFRKNVYAYLEYYHNDLGALKRNYSTLRASLQSRISRGELFTVGPDYLSPGLRIECTPRVNLYTSSIFNLHDSSGYFQARTAFDWFPDSLLTVGLNVPYGTRGTEFGGIAVPGTDAFLGRGLQGFVRVGYYF